VDWARRLGVEDTIITFNYDTVIERLGRKVGGTVDAISCPAPGEEPPPGIARAYKLHGSVNWLSRDTGESQRVVYRTDDPFAALSCDMDTKIAIGNPGPTKSKLTKMLDPLWQAAGAALAKASAFVFVGYRFPPTDTFAQQFLLDGIEKNRNEYLAIHVVLGPNIGSPDIVRARQLLAQALASRQEMPMELLQSSPYPNSCNLLVWSLYAADFLGRVHSEQITHPFRSRPIP
jgi:hypothetical protein